MLFSLVAGHFIVPEQHHLIEPVCQLRLAQVMRALLASVIYSRTELVQSGSSSFARTTSLTFKSCGGCQACSTCMFSGSPRIPSLPPPIVRSPLRQRALMSTHLNNNYRSLQRANSLLFDLFSRATVTQIAKPSSSSCPVSSSLTASTSLQRSARKPRTRWPNLLQQFQSLLRCLLRPLPLRSRGKAPSKATWWRR